MSQTVKTLIWAAIGLTLFFVAASVDYHWLRTLAVPIYLVVLGLLTLTMLVGTNLFGAQMSVTVAGLDFQFSEVSKVLMIAVLAAFLAGRRERIGRLSTILVAGALMAVPTLLVFRQPDLGTALVFVGILLGMLFMSGASLGWMGFMAAGVIAAAPIAVSMLHDYQRARLFCFLDPYADAQGACYQLVQALNAVGSGGWLGRGSPSAARTSAATFRSNRRTSSSPSWPRTSASSAASWCWRCSACSCRGSCSSAGRRRTRFGMMIAAGLASMILFQLLVNVGMVIGIMPVTGIPLPFVTYGGSSLISLLFGLGILQSIRMRAHKPTL